MLFGTLPLKWKAVWMEKSGSNKTHKDFWNFDLNHKNSETKWEIKYCESSLSITTMTVVLHQGDLNRDFNPFFLENNLLFPRLPHSRCRHYGVYNSTQWLLTFYWYRTAACCFASSYRKLKTFQLQKSGSQPLETLSSNTLPNLSCPCHTEECLGILTIKIQALCVRINDVHMQYFFQDPKLQQHKSKCSCAGCGSIVGTSAELGQGVLPIF